MNDRSTVGPVFQNLKVDQNLGGLLALARELVAFEIEDHHILGLHEAFADHCRRCKDAAVGKAVGHVAAVGFDVLPVPKPLADFAKLLARFPFRELLFVEGSSVCHAPH